MVRFKMFKISAPQFVKFEENFPEENTSVEFEVSFGFSVSMDRHCVACSMTSSFKGAKGLILLLETICEFNIENTDWKGFESKDRFVIPKDILQFFAVHTVGTSRGILFCKTDNTILNQFIIPPINVAELVKDLVIKK